MFRLLGRLESRSTNQLNSLNAPKITTHPPNPLLHPMGDNWMRAKKRNRQAYHTRRAMDSHPGGCTHGRGGSAGRWNEKARQYQESILRTTLRDSQHFRKGICREYPSNGYGSRRN